MIAFRNIDTKYESYQFLVDFYHQNKNKSHETIEISFKNVSWIAGNTCSMLGAIFQKLTSSFNSIRITNITEKIENILLRNGFLSFFGRERESDSFHTTIQYLKLFPGDNRYFSQYIRDDLLSKEDIPDMSHKLKKKITEGIYEIFVNAAMHSETEEGIFTCGQFFPNRKEIQFMVTDLGTGIKEQVNRFLGRSFSAVEAIEWAMEERNTTKTRDSGGLGLAILKSFIGLNQGKIQIISNDGFWEFSREGTVRKSFRGGFPGTVVNICIKTNDNMTYRLQEETVDDDDIF